MTASQQFNASVEAAWLFGMVVRELDDALAEIPTPTS